MSPRSRPAPVPSLRRAVPMALLTTLLAATVAGCGAATSGASLAASTAVASDAAATPVPPVKVAGIPSAAVQPAGPAPTHHPASGLPWPASNAAGVADLQKAVDGGSQPWLLEPAEVAESYAAFRGWTNVQVSGGADGATPTRVTVRSSAGTHTLTLAQPDRKGRGGIWLISDDSTG